MKRYVYRSATDLFPRLHNHERPCCSNLVPLLPKSKGNAREWEMCYRTTKKGGSEVFLFFCFFVFLNLAIHDDLLYLTLMVFLYSLALEWIRLGEWMRFTLLRGVTAK